jgi:hypothetical protein
MFAKAALERVDDTVGYIGTTTVVPAQYRRAAKGMVEMFLNSQHPNLGGPAFNQMSNQMSLGARPAGQLSEPRQQARAIYLLWKAMEWASGQNVAPFANAAAIPQLNIADLFEYTIYKALIVYDAKNNSAFAAKHVLENVLAKNTIHFLTHNHLIIRGSPKRVAGTGDLNVLPFYFYFDPGSNRFIIEQVPGPGRYQFNAATIAATHWTKVPGRGNDPNTGSFAQIDAIEVGGSRVVVTTQFTGCSLCLRSHGGRLYGAHIAPGEAINTPPEIGSGHLLAQQLCGSVPNVTGAAFSNAPGPVRVYGRQCSNIPAFPNGYGGPNLQYFTMIGFDNGGGWSLYAQDNELLQGGFAGGPITNVRQIFP